MKRQSENKRMLFITILAIALLQTLASSSVAPALKSIGGDFTNANPFTLKLIMTLPSICIIAMSLLIVRLSHMISTRNLTLLGLILYLVGGVGGSLVTNMTQLLILRGVLGIGLGILGPLLPIIISTNYSGMDRSKMIGYMQSTNFLGGIIGTVLAGIVISISWRYVFFLYLLAIPALILTYATFKKSEIDNNVSHQSESNKKRVVKLEKASYLLAGCMLGNMFVFFSAPLSISIYLPMIGLSNPTYSGIAVGVLYLGNLLSGFSFTQIHSRFKDNTIPVALMLQCVGYLVLSTSVNFSMVIGAMLLIGSGSGIIVPTIFSKVPETVRTDQVARTMTLVNASLYLGMFLSPYISIVSLLLGYESMSFDFLVLSILVLTATIVYFYLLLKKRGGLKWLANRTK